MYLVVERAAPSGARDPSVLWCSPEPQLSPLALGLLFASSVPASPFLPLFPWAPAPVPDPVTPPPSMPIEYVWCMQREVSS